MTNRITLVATLLVSALCGCSSSPKERFSHRFHRLQYRLTDDEIKGLQFYLSAEVIAQTKSPSDRTPTGSNVIIVPRDVPGAATHVGPNWIKVAFREGGDGVPFLSDTTATDDVYLNYSLATQVEGANTLRKVADVPGHIGSYNGVSYAVADGYDAILMVDGDQLQALIEKRRIREGVKAK